MFWKIFKYQIEIKYLEKVNMILLFSLSENS